MSQEIIPAGAPMGRPSSFSWERANVILDRLSMGEGLKTICRDSDMPAQVTVLRWLRCPQDEKHPWADDFRNRYARAREDQADALFDDILEISDDGRNDWMEKRDKDGNLSGFAVNGEHVHRSKLRVDARKWMAAKLKPKSYGEKLDVTTDGAPINNSTQDIATRAASLVALAVERKQEKEKDQ